MTTTMHRRLDRLSARVRPPARAIRRAICSTDDEVDAARASKAPGEFLIIRRIVTPGGEHGGD